MREIKLFGAFANLFFLFYPILSIKIAIKTQIVFRGSRKGTNTIKSVEESRKKVQTIEKNHKNKSDHPGIVHRTIFFISA